jgi:uncharacterized repeat protein (TIGR01451 family)
MKRSCYLLLSFLLLNVHNAFAEGTYEIQQKTASTDMILFEAYEPGFASGSDLNLDRATILFVDVLNFEEVIDIYTNKYQNTTDIAVWAPGDDVFTDTPVATFNVSQNGTGYIGSFAEVENVQNIATRPRTPYTFTPGSGTGVYKIVLYTNSAGNQATDHIAYFDVMVRDTKGTAGMIDDVLRRGRLWSDHFALNGRNFNTAMGTEFYMIDASDEGTFYEGYLWKGDMNGIQPFGFHMFVNRNGAFPSQYYNTSVGSGASPTPQMVPQLQMYLNYPEKPVVRPTIPTVENLIFRSTCTVNNPEGGFFEFNTNGEWTFEIVIDEDDDGIYDRGSERTITGPATPGNNQIPWDGLLADGSAAPNGLTVKVVLRTKASEIHFPFYDVENQQSNTGPVFNLLPSDNETSELYYWDDSGVGGSANLGGSLSSHNWGNSIGNSTIVDTWKVAFEDIQEYVLRYDCNSANMIMKKHVDNNRPATGEQIIYDVIALSGGPADASGITINDQLPAGVTYVSHTTTNGTYNQGTGDWTLTGMPVGQLDTLTITATVDGGTEGDIITNTANITALDQSDADPSNNTASAEIRVGLFRIAGKIFEDIRYGGGSGRSLASATGSEVLNGVRVELYDQSDGSFISFNITNPLGEYEFLDIEPGDYYVRVVNSTITSKRQDGTSGGIIPVQTFRAEAPSGALTPVTNEIGGSDPTKTDAGPNGGTTNFADLSSASEAALSVSSVQVSGANYSAVNFGFNYNTIVNTNNTGQGSLRQFMINANTLGNGGLNQDGLEAGVDHSIFSIPTSDPGYNGQYFVINLSTNLPSFIDSFTRIEGSTQQLLTGNTHASSAEITTGPEIEINGVGGPVFVIQTGQIQINDVAITGSTGTGINGTAVHFVNVSAAGSQINNSTIYQNATHGVYFSSGVQNISVNNSIIRANGVSDATASGLFLNGASNISIAGNTVINNQGDGITLDGGTSGIVIDNNLIKNNGSGNASYQAGIAVRDGSSSNISDNTITGNDGDGVLVVSGTQNTITQNSIYGNGELGIDLGTGTNGDEVTLNDSGDGDAGGNNLLNYPILVDANVINGFLAVSGYASAGNTIELFLSDEDASGFGEGETFLLSFDEGGGDDQDSDPGSYSGNINGINQGSDNVQKFLISVAVPAGVSLNSVLTATLTDGNGNTSEFSGNVVVVLGDPTLNGNVYLDENTNLFRDGNEAGTGITIYAKLVESGTVIDVATVNTSTGEYEFNEVPPSTYTIVFDDNNSTGDLSPNRPANYISTETPDYQIGPFTTNLYNQFSLNAGLFHGAKLTGLVFLDTGDGGGTANNGVRDGSEQAIGSIKVQARNGGSLLNEKNTNADGEFTLWIPHSANGSSITIQETNEVRYPVSTGATVGTTGGSYNRGTDEITFTVSSGQSYSGIQFGDAGVPTLVGNIDRNAEKGTAVFIPHTFTAPSTGNVTFSVSNTASPVNGGWTQLLYEDTNANGQLDPGETQVSGSISVTKGQEIALVVKVSVPSTGAVGGKNTIIIEGDMSYSNAAPALNRVVNVTDVITINDAGSAGLELVKAVDQANALPGATLLYTITYKNKGSQAITNVIINDSTPPYTNFASASHQTLPDGVNSITITNPTVGESGTITWTFDGELRSGATGTIQYTVQIDN